VRESGTGEVWECGSAGVWECRNVGMRGLREWEYPAFARSQRLDRADLAIEHSTAQSEQTLCCLNSAVLLRNACPSREVWIVHSIRDMEFEHLRRRSRQFAVDVVKFCRKLPRDPYTVRLGCQLHDAGTAVAANYHASCRARSRAEFIAKIGVVVEEADESVMWLTVMKEAEITSGPQLEALLQEATELRAIFARSSGTARGNG